MRTQEFIETVTIERFLIYKPQNSRLRKDFKLYGLLILGFNYISSCTSLMISIVYIIKDNNTAIMISQMCLI